MSIRLTILGCHSATPRSDAHPTSQYLEINNRHFLIDCGEGTQMQLRKYKVKFSRIKHIFISHLHGDHFFGLIGLISTFGLLNRPHELHIYAPKDLKTIIEMQLRLSKSWVDFPLHFHELTSEKSELIFEDKQVSVYTIPMNHRIYTNGFLFKEKRKDRKLALDKIKLYPEIEICDYHKIKKGFDFVRENGEIISNDLLTESPKEPLSYAYCSDTSYHESCVPMIKKADLLYHESTFLEDNKELAEKTKHSTAKEAATIAKIAEVKQLILGHFSNRYKDEQQFLNEAAAVFPEVQLAETGKVFTLLN